ncbi:MAG: lycopene cyclase domain-containing protein [Chitinophagaceae bacterium]
MKFSYLLVDFFTVIVPFLFSFHPKLQFHKTWKAFFPAVILSGLYFIIWDAWFTGMGVWGFNSQYLTGISISNLPVEEILFFFCIPYACVFTFHCLKNYIGNSISRNLENTITIALIAILTVAGILYYQRLYTVFTFLSLAGLLAISRYVLNITWLGKFYIVYAILLLPFLVVNGILTGTGLENPIVWYNDTEIIGLRILTIPVEDVFYGMELVLMNLLLYRHLLTKNKFYKKASFSRA